MKKKDCWFGIYHIKFIWNGEWSDPELMYKKHEFNYWDIESFFYDIFTAEKLNCTFEEWMNNNGQLVKSHLNYLIEMGY